jgi:hypothetical protein
MVLPSEEILVVGSYYIPNQNLLFNHVTNTWRTLPNTNGMQGKVKLGFKELGYNKL